MSTALIDYGSGNLRSAAKAFERAAREVGLAADIQVTGDAKAVAAADRIVLPGVGAFADCKRGLMAVPGMGDALEEAVIGKARPFLGICVGMQLMATRGLEFAVTEGLGWVPGEVVAIEPKDKSLKIPHMGWNDLRIIRQHPMLAGIKTGDHAYFVHSYRFAAVAKADVYASVDYGGPITAAIGRENLFGVQFHPEKSEATGLRLISNFLRWKP
ncbi:MAG: imidazole glycerol phosphate synthase subunit HisH [Stellaceae bacterium]